MKRFLIFLSLLFCNVLYADTINLNFMNDDNTSFTNSTCTIGGDLNIPNTIPTKRGYTFAGWQPANVQRIEYLESTGTQYIDTGYHSNQNTGIKAKFKYNSITSTDAAFGGRNSNGSAQFQSFIAYQKVYFSYGNPSLILSDTAVVGDTFVIDWDKNILKYSLNDSALITYAFNSYTFSTSGVFCLFVSCPETQVPATRGKVSIYYFQIYDNDVLVRDFIPVIKDGVPCMYDKVGHKFYYNQGTGNFTAGPVITEI